MRFPCLCMAWGIRPLEDSKVGVWYCLELWGLSWRSLSFGFFIGLVYGLKLMCWELRDSIRLLKCIRAIIPMTRTITSKSNKANPQPTKTSSVSSTPTNSPPNPVPNPNPNTTKSPVTFQSPFLMKTNKKNPSKTCSQSSNSTSMERMRITTQNRRSMKMRS